MAHRVKEMIPIVEVKRRKAFLITYFRFYFISH